MSFNSDAARFQAYQTRTKIGGALWSRVIMTVVLVWVGITVWLVWWDTGPEHPFFAYWVLCGILTDTPVLCRLTARWTIPIHRVWYSLPDLTVWLNGPQMYGHSFYAWYWHRATGLAGHYGFGTNLLPVGIGLLFAAWRWRRDPQEADHIRGLELVSERRFNRELNGGFIRRMIQRSHDEAE